MIEEYHCDTCGEETNFVINGVAYCAEHAFDGIGVQARLVASLNGADADKVRHMGQWAQHEVAEMFGIQP
jgi:hypothetical protein